MDCPKCVSSELTGSLGPKGVAVDRCLRCYGIWFDKGELYSYVRDQHKVYEFLKTAYQKTKDSARKCPRCKVAMREVELTGAGGMIIEACPACGGNWLDEGEIVQLNQHLGTGIDPHDPAYLIASAGAPDQPERPEAPVKPKRPSRPAAALRFAAAAGAADTAWKAMAGAPLRALPSLALRSWGVLASLYGILAAFSFIFVAYLKLPMHHVFIYAALVIVLSFAAGPFFTDFTLTWLHKMKWVEPHQLPPHLQKFISEAFEKENVAFPSVGVIEDGSPNAFTYGHYPGNARIVFTRGLFDLLDEDETRAVAAHEIGHVMHWDMMVMTMAALVPVILYYIYRGCMRSSRSSRPSSSKKGGNPLPLIGMVALVLYYITEYLVLFLSRVREYYADRYSGELTREPNKLASALIKIAYGLAGRREPTAKEKAEGTAEISAAKTLGIFDKTSAKALVASSLGEDRRVSTENILNAMQWDLWNPWARYYELNSTHPLTAKRIDRLGEQAASYGQRPLVHFDLEQPESYWDEFLVDLFYNWLPLIGAGTAAALLFLKPEVLPLEPRWFNIAAGFLLGHIGQTTFAYRTDLFADMSVSALLKRVKVSKVRGIPARIEGKIIGRGIPGYIFSEDLVLQDKTGFIFVDYDQPLAIFNFLFAITRGPKLIDQDVAVEGWYRRAPVPFFEVRRIHHAEGESKCWVLEAKYIGTALLLAGFVLTGAFLP